MSDSEKAAKVMEALKAAEREPAQIALPILSGIVGLVQGDHEQGLEVEEARSSAFLAICEVGKARTVCGRPMGGSDQRNRTVDGAGEVKLFISARDVRFSANSGLKSDIAPCPLCANSGSRGRAYSIKSLMPRDGTARHSGSPALRRPSI